MSRGGRFGHPWPFATLPTSLWVAGPHASGGDRRIAAGRRRDEVMFQNSPKEAAA